jgi:hypothetical protein
MRDGADCPGRLDRSLLWTILVRAIHAPTLGPGSFGVADVPGLTLGVGYTVAKGR